MEQAMIRREPLSAEYGIYVSDEHSFGTDAILLADFASRGRKGLKAVDLGTGCGIIPMLMIKRGAVSEVTGLEISAAACSLADRTIRENSVQGTFGVINCDLRVLPSELKKGYFDLVTCNPPYKAAGAGIVSRSKADRVARHETECTLGDVFTAAAKLLRFSGRLCICQRPERLADIFVSMREAGIEPKRFREVIQREGGKAWLVLVEGRLGGKSGIETMPPLYIEKGGILSPEMIDIYGEYKKGHGEGV